MNRKKHLYLLLVFVLSSLQTGRAADSLEQEIRIQLDRDNGEQALILLKKAQPDKAPYPLLRAKALFSCKQYQKAARLAAANKDFFLAGRSLILLFRSLPKKARKALYTDVCEALQKNKRTERIILALEWSLAPHDPKKKVRSYSTARRSIEKSSFSPARAAVIAEILIENEKYKDAIEFLKRHTKKHKKNAMLFNLLGEALGKRTRQVFALSRIGLARRSLAAFEKAVSLAPSDAGHRYDLMQYYMRAPGFMGGDKDKGRKQARVAKKNDPGLGGKAMARYFQLKKKSKAAENEYRTAIQVEPMNPALHMAYGNFLMDLKEYHKAVTVFKRMAEIFPTRALPRYTAADAIIRSGKNLTNAIPLLEAYVKKRAPYGPTISDAYEKLQQIMEKTGNKAKALVYEKCAADERLPGEKKQNKNRRNQR
mgnify:CR=1 FL=1